jgi:F420-dependent oxidoreductase-like protein
MDLRNFTEPQQGATYDDLLAVARAAEDLGFDGFFRSDHYLHMSGDGGSGPTDAWTTLAGLARDTTRLRLGTLVTSATFRLPGPLSVQVAGVDQMSGGRVELGLGAGWFEAEHAAYGIPFPSVGERFDRLEEQLAVITGLWATPTGETFSHDGPHYPVVDSPALTKPVQPGGIPIIIGGGGKRRTPALAARYASEFNAAFVSVEDSEALFDRVAAAAESIGRDAGTLVRSAAQVVCLGSDDATLARRAAAIGREVDELRENGLAGSPAEIVDKLGRFEQAGASRVYLQVLDLSDLGHLADIAEGVLRQLA